ncbi:MAG: ACT domain-containing protein [Firmicutes bacterium HGW-Firmicutes-1]|jgi:hypothetical protein|nr:MAG: ACT domain-containing protein [Firmicutes bacterium HGW-Firmicutes-1]
MGEKRSLCVLSEKFCVNRLDPSEEIPNWVRKSNWYSITVTDEELSIVCEESVVPDDVKTEGGWRCIKVIGPLEFGQIGILAGISKILAEKNISIFVVSTYDTDYILIKENTLDKTLAALVANGYDVK